MLVGSPARVGEGAERVYWGALDERLELKVVVEVGDVRHPKNSYYCLLLTVARSQYGL